jgi:hypothetical protein
MGPAGRQPDIARPGQSFESSITVDLNDALEGKPENGPFDVDSLRLLLGAGGNPPPMIALAPVAGGSHD